jgi:hypothetical protein
MTFNYEPLQKAMKLADDVDAMDVGSEHDFGGVSVYRESPTRYTVNGGETCCFVEAIDRVRQTWRQEAL